MPARLRLPAILGAAALLATLAGCSGNSDDAAGPTTTTAPTTRPATSAPTSSSPPSTTPPSTSPPSSTPPTPTSTTGSSGSSRLRARQAQIPAADLPGLNSSWVWQQSASGWGPGQDVPAVCLKSSLSAIGAKAEFRTDFSSTVSPDASATQMTAVFPDEQTLATAVQVLRSWHDGCQSYATKRLRLSDVSVGAIESPSTSVGPGEQWLTTYKPAPGGADNAWFQATGFVADGDTLTFLVMTSVGQDYNYPAGKQPMDQALKVAANQLVATR